MLLNDIKKGMELRMSPLFGVERIGKMADNKKGLIRMVEVTSHYNEIGSVYGDEIKFVKVGNNWEPVELSPAQKKQRAAIRAGGF